MTKEELERVRATVDRGNSAGNNIASALLAHIDAQAARIAVLEGALRDDVVGDCKGESDDCDQPWCVAARRALRRPRGQRTQRPGDREGRAALSTTHEMYGHFLGGDPRRFTPDEECCTPKEIEAWKAACEAWERGEKCEAALVPRWKQTETSVIHVSGSSYGIGVYTWDCDGNPDCPECEPPAPATKGESDRG